MSGEAYTDAAPEARRRCGLPLRYGILRGFLCCVFESFAQHEIPFAVWTPPAGRPPPCPVRTTRGRTLPEDAAGLSALGETGPGDGISRQPGFSLRQEDKELLLIRFLHRPSPLGPSSQSDGPPGCGRSTNEKESRLGDWIVRTVAGEHDRMQVRSSPQKLIYCLAQGHFCSRFPEELHDIRRSPSGEYCFIGSTRLSFWSWLRRWSCRPAPGTGSSSLEAVLTRWNQGPPQQKGG